jgi:hypothetical protein
MNPLLIRAQLSTALATAPQLPDDIQWMPPGRHTITPLVGEKPTTFTLEVNAALAARVSAEFETLRTRAAAGEGDVPYLDFNHQDQAASAEVLDLYWAGDHAKTGGIRAKVKWTKAGRDALEGRSFRRFSPQWYSHPDTHEFQTIAENLGGLVNRAAFSTIQPVVAQRGDHNTTTSNMTDTELKAALTEALKPVTDRLTALETKATSAATIPDAVETRLKALETATGKTTAAQAKAAVAVHARRGAIPPQNTDVLAFWETQYQADPDKTEKVLAALADNPALAQVTQAGNGGAAGGALTQATDATRAQKQEEAINAHRAANPGASYVDARNAVRAKQPALFA